MHFLDCNWLFDGLLNVAINFRHSLHCCSHIALHNRAPRKYYLAVFALLWGVHQTRIWVFTKLAKVNFSIFLLGSSLDLIACFWRQNELVIKKIGRVLLRYDWLETRKSFLLVKLSPVFTNLFFVLVFTLSVWINDDKIKLFSFFIVFKLSGHLNRFTSVPFWVKYANSANLSFFLFFWRLWFIVRLN